MPRNIAINQLLAESTSIPNLVQKYSKQLRSTGSIENIIHANKLEEYSSMITDTSFLNKIKDTFDSIYDILARQAILFSLDGRRKSFYSFENKVNLLLENKNSLDLLRDIFAFRIIVFDYDSPEQTVRNLYHSMNVLIEFLTTQGFIPCESTNTKEGKKFDHGKYPNIYVPSQSGLNPKYEDLVKDYVLHPKANGYQSLHASFRDVRTGRFFEVQIRSITMHIHAEGYASDISEICTLKNNSNKNHSPKTANHSEYKKSKYSSVSEKWDLKNVNISGFRYIGLQKTISDTGQIIEKDIYLDLVGLIDALIILSRRHAF